MQAKPDLLFCETEQFEIAHCSEPESEFQQWQIGNNAQYQNSHVYFVIFGVVLHAPKIEYFDCPMDKSIGREQGNMP